MRHRQGKLKIKHGIIKGLKRFLEDRVTVLDYVSSIIPGEIKVGNAAGENLIVSYKYDTISGAKLIAKSGSSIQEVFVITRSPEELKKVIEGFSAD